MSDSILCLVRTFTSLVLASFFVTSVVSWLLSPLPFSAAFDVKFLPNVPKIGLLVTAAGVSFSGSLCFFSSVEVSFSFSFLNELTGACAFAGSCSSIGFLSFCCFSASSSSFLIIYHKMWFSFNLPFHNRRSASTRCPWRSRSLFYSSTVMAAKGQTHAAAFRVLVFKCKLS